jgi:hypothetical protein
MWREVETKGGVCEIEGRGKEKTKTEPAYV